MALNSAVTPDGGEIGRTLALLAPSERARVVGFVINRFRGDLARLQPGLDWLERPDGTV
ncbi:MULTISPECIES: hypothetical protein [unclassified Thiocapsa]|uniref:hypothetical protein n=1 Tax=unclassified Thiocapsa TaxID=2641286 RepID=UPI0035B20743